MAWKRASASASSSFHLSWKRFRSSSAIAWAEAASSCSCSSFARAADAPFLRRLRRDHAGASAGTRGCSSRARARRDTHAASLAASLSAPLAAAALFSAPLAAAALALAALGLAAPAAVLGRFCGALFLFARATPACQMRVACRRGRGSEGHLRCVACCGACCGACCSAFSLVGQPWPLRRRYRSILLAVLLAEGVPPLLSFTRKSHIPLQQVLVILFASLEPARHQRLTAQLPPPLPPRYSLPRQLFYSVGARAIFTLNPIITSFDFGGRPQTPKRARNPPIFFG